MCFLCTTTDMTISTRAYLQLSLLHEALTGRRVRLCSFESHTLSTSFVSFINTNFNQLTSFHLPIFFFCNFSFYFYSLSSSNSHLISSLYHITHTHTQSTYLWDLHVVWLVGVILQSCFVITVRQIKHIWCHWPF